MANAAGRRLRAEVFAAAVLTGLACSTRATRAGDDLPPAVSTAAAAIVRAVSFAGLDGAGPQAVATNEIPRIDVDAVTPPYTPDQRRRVQGEFCRMNGLAVCPVFTEENRGTAFAVDGGGRFLTCRHLVHDWIYWAWKLNGEATPARAIVPPIVLVSRSGRLAGTSRHGRFRKTLYVEDDALLKPLASLLRDERFWDMDFFGFQLPVSRIDHSLARGPVPGVGENAHVLGFAPKGERQALMAASGHITRVGEANIESNAPSQPGMSGAPILDDLGRVVGVSCARGTAVAGGRRGALASIVGEARLAAFLWHRWGVELQVVPPSARPPERVQSKPAPQPRRPNP